MRNLFRSLVFASLCGIFFEYPIATAASLPDSVSQDLELFSDLAPVELKSVTVKREIARDAADTKPGPLRFAVPRKVALSTENSGSWVDLSSTKKIWALKIRVPGATDINVFFKRFHLPTDASLYLVSEAHGYAQGPYTHDDNKPNGQFWSPILPGDSLTVLVYASAKSAAAVRLTLGAVNSGYRDLHGLSGPPNLLKQGTCNIDVICSEADDWRDEIRSVGRYSLEGVTLCTGTLINAADNSQSPYFLTAFHCGVNSGNAPSMVVYWNYESPTCGQLGGGSLADNQLGAQYRAGRLDVDMALVELDDVPSAAFNVHYAGWDRSGTAAPSSTGIHHPNTDEKAISFNDNGMTTASNCITTASGDTHWYVDWEQGTTEPGSSGSGMWDDQFRLIGFLSGGTASCDNPTGFDCYGRFDVAWDGSNAAQRLRDWLDPLGSSVNSVDGSDPLPRLMSPAWQLPAGGERFAADTIVNLQWTETEPVAQYQLEYTDQCSDVEVFFDDMEAGGGNWRTESISADNWSHGQDNPHSAVAAWFSASAEVESDQMLELSAPVPLPANPRLSFWHDYDFELGFDGGVIEVSTDGVNWFDLGDDILIHAYDGFISSDFASPIGGRMAFTGTSGGYRQTIVDLSSWSGQAVYLRFRATSDSTLAEIGWYVDDVRIYDAGQTVWTPIATTAPGDGSYAWHTPLQAGEDYCVRVRGSAPGYVPTDSVISNVFAIEPSLPNSSTLGDFVWSDDDGDGVQDPGESGLPGVTVNLLTCPGQFLQSRVTDAEGVFLFENLAPGSYRLAFELKAGYQYSPRRAVADFRIDSNAIPTTGRSRCVSLRAGQIRLSRDAGMVPETPVVPGTASMGDYVWEDQDGDGVQDRVESGLANAEVVLEDCAGNALASTTTDADGGFLFSELAAGQYRMRFIAPTGFEFSPLRAGNRAGRDSNADPNTGLTACLSLADDQHRGAQDAGLRPL